MRILRKVEPYELPELVDLWLTTSLIAHPFIPGAYWRDNKAAMLQEYLPASEVYVIDCGGRLCGFLALVDDHVAALFISPFEQGKGYGTQLLNYAKTIRSELTLNVYQKNQQSVQYYQKNGFEIHSETVDTASGEKEYSMRWRC
ncbi:GNAT family N-acetyltransferase [Siphonobacter curvatus]|uniref:GNAT family N-acetyltransferase n=1 Tax=Siphonobacter curvatus TaxID=2094562 RepID=A0A2S7IJG8_9BACT|nr:GNAT family N-acetyltransferase [Siphonobacter curvatus]PQA56741.1 GNAT family N-acetyltransferase [Siphonobacter curvatus]